MIFKSVWIGAMSLLLLTAGVAAAQEERRVDVYICDVECSHTVVSQEYTVSEFEFLLGESAPGPDSIVVCFESGGCGWSQLPIEDIEIAAGGDGIVEPIDFFPAPLPAPSGPPSSEPADPSQFIDDLTLDNREFWVMNCRNDVCTIGRRKVSAREASTLTGTLPPPGNHYIRCDGGRCGWTAGDTTLQPRDGAWSGSGGVLLANNCIDDAALEAIEVPGSSVKTWSRPPRISNFWEDSFTGWDRVNVTAPAPNTYELRLQMGFDQFRSVVTYQWVVLSETFIGADVTLELPSLSGRCFVYITVTMRHVG